MVIELTEEQKEKIKNKFSEYLNSDKTAKDIANELGLEKSTISKFYLKTFGGAYKKIAKIKSHSHCIKISDEGVFQLFDKYKSGISMKDLAESVGLKYGCLAPRMRRLVGNEYTKISKIRKHEDVRKGHHKVSNESISTSFERYKSNSISTTALAKELGLAESSLISRFKRLFKDDYNILALKRRNERKVSKEEYIKAFEEYKNSSISLVDLSMKLNVRISTIRPRFLNLFGEEYLKIAERKLDASALNLKGKQAEELALDFLKKKGFEVRDIRKHACLKGTLKRPDFIIGDTFVEVKSHYINLENRRVKGYNKIIQDYLGRETKDGVILSKGIIISLGGFSKEVISKADQDGIKLIDFKKGLNVVNY